MQSCLGRQFCMLQTLVYAFTLMLLLCDAVLQEAVAVIASAIIVKFTLYLVLYSTVGVLGDLSVTAGFITHLMAGSFCAFCWSTGQVVLCCCRRILVGAALLAYSRMPCM